MTQLDLEAPCPTCGKAIGDHTHREYATECLKGFEYTLPFEDVAGGPIKFPGVDGELVGEVSVMAGAIDSAMGRVPLLRFVFTGAGTEPMSRRSLPPINLVMDANGLKTVRQIVATAVDRAVLFARRGR